MSKTGKLILSPADKRWLSRDRDGEVAYMLRCCSAEMTAYGGFVWPESGRVEPHSWSSEPECGDGLHGWLWGEGDVSMATHAYDGDARWLVCAVWSADVVDLGGKIKVPRAVVVFCGSRDAATAEIMRLGARGAVIFGTAIAGDLGTASAGARGTATAGYAGTATAGVGGTAIAGDHGTATASVGGTASAGKGGVIVLKHWDGRRYRLVVGYVGEDIEPNVPYRLDEDGKFVRAEEHAEELVEAAG